MNRMLLAVLCVLGVQAVAADAPSPKFPQLGIVADNFEWPVTVRPEVEIQTKVDHVAVLTSTNADSSIFTKEMGMLQALMKQTDADLAAKGKRAMIFPGHGDFYGVEQAGW